MHRKYIIYSPFCGSNAYIDNMKRCWENLFEVISPTCAEENLYILLNTRAIVLNWVEHDLNLLKKRRLLCYKLLGIKIIWVFHNRVPHNTGKNADETEAEKRNMRFMARISDIIILHSENSRRYLKEYTENENKAFFIPHISYLRQSNWMKECPLEMGRPFCFVFQGAISPYKNIELLIRAFQELNLPNCELCIVGRPCSAEYANKLMELIDCSTIKFTFEYISDYEVGRVIQKGDVMVLPYDLKSSMNSGAMIAAFSNKRTVIVCANAMAQDFREEDFLYIYDYSNQESHYCQLKAAMKLAYENGIAVNRAKGEKAFEYIRRHNSEEIVVKRLKKMVKERL